MAFSIFRLDNHIVHIDFYLFMNQIMQSDSGCLFISTSGIFQPKRHDGVAVGPLWRDESYLLLVVCMHFYLVVNRKTIYEGFQGM